jgi:hypothetical protein
MRTEEQAACEQTILRIGAVGASLGAVVSVAGIGFGNLTILNGTWPSILSYFHGVPFILSEVAVASATPPGSAASVSLVAQLAHGGQRVSGEKNE